MNKSEMKAWERRQEILEMLEQEDMTKAEIANRLGVSVATVENDLRDLRQTEQIIHGSFGISLVNGNDLENNPETVARFSGFVNWMTGTFLGAIKMMQMSRPLFPAYKRAMLENYTLEERRELKNKCARIVALISYAEAMDETE